MPYAEVLLSRKKQNTHNTASPNPAAIPYASLIASSWAGVI